MSTLIDLAIDDRFDPAEIARIRDLFLPIGVPQIHDAAPTEVRILDSSIVLRTPRFKLAGPLFPVVTDDDILPGLQALEVAPRGAILFLHDVCPDGDAITGDIVVTTVREQGLGGIIVNGAIRDIEFIQDLGMAVFSRSVNPISAKTERPATDLPAVVELGDGIVLRPGDWVFGDLDGIAVVPAEIVADVIVKAVAIFDREAEIKAGLEAGARLAELTGSQEFAASGAPMKFRP